MFLFAQPELASASLFLFSPKQKSAIGTDGKIGCALNKKRGAKFARPRERFFVMKTKNILLTASLAAFAVGFSDLQENLFFWAGRPVGALLFGMYLIYLVLEDASALHDQQEKEKLTRISGAKNSAQSIKQTKEACAPSLTTAPSH